MPKLQFALGGQHSPVQGASSALSTSIRQVRQRSLSSTVAPYSSSAFAVTGNSSSTNISDGAYSALGGGGGGIRQRSLSSSVAPYNSGAFSLPGHSSASSSSSALGSSIYRDQENVHNNSSTDGGEGGGNCGGDIEQDMTFGSNSRVYRDVPVTVNININDDTDDDTDDEEDGGDGAKDGGGDVEAGGGGDAEEVDPADEAVCCPSLFDRLAALAACLSCTAKSRSLDASHSGSANHSKGGGGSGGAMDSSKHGLLEEGESSKQLINAASSADHRSDASQSGTHSDANSPPAPPLSTSTVLTQRVVVLATLNYGMICASSILMDETLPLFLKAPASEGGFGFTSAEIGMLLSIGAGGMMALTMLTMPLTNGVSNKWISKFSLAVSIPLVLAFPAIALLNNQVFAHIRSNTERLWLLWPVLIIVNTVKNLFTCMAFTSAILMVNHSVTDEYLGAVNGLGQSLGALARSLGPAVGGLLWSVGTRYNFAYFNFIATTLLYLLNYYVSHLVPKSLDHRKKPKGNKLK